MPRATLTTAATLALAIGLAVPVAAADVQLPGEPMSAEEGAAIDAGIAAIMGTRRPGGSY